jgi:hypothetical protein
MRRIFPSFATPRQLDQELVLKFEQLRTEILNTNERLDWILNECKALRAQSNGTPLLSSTNGSRIQVTDPIAAVSTLADIMELIVPHNCPSITKVRLGALHDGGYICLDDFAETRAALSLGINDDVTWDIDLIDRNNKTTVFQYDHTVDGPPNPNHNFKFHKTRIVPNRNSEDGVTIEQIVSAYRICRTDKPILKMDIEGSEWDVFDEMPESTLNIFSQILVEFHGFEHIGTKDFGEKALRVFRKLSKSFRLVHVHGNNWGAQLAFGPHLFPAVLEISFANADFYPLEVSGETFPGPLDKPCNGAQPDYPLADFQYLVKQRIGVLG